MTNRGPTTHRMCGLSLLVLVGLALPSMGNAVVFNQQDNARLSDIITTLQSLMQDVTSANIVGDKAIPLLEELYLKISNTRR